MKSEKGVPLNGEFQSGLNLFDEQGVFPVAVLISAALKQNSVTMSDFCRVSGVLLAPHGKTTMSPQLFQMQINDGAWGITAANVYQAKVMKESGISRVLIANEVTTPSDIAWLATQINTDFELFCYVDSILGVKLIEKGIQNEGVYGKLKILIEVGVAGGRTGVRLLDEAVKIAQAVAQSPSLQLVGVSGFEGIIAATNEESAEVQVDRFLDYLSELAVFITNNQLVPELREFIISAGGSVFFDRVVKRLKDLVLPIPVQVIIRSGCYLSHDDGVIHELSPLGVHPRVPGSPFEAALEVWAPVLSRPERTRLVLGVGKRDLSTDSLFPQAKKWVSRGSHTVFLFPNLPRATKVDDQHTYIDVEENCEIQVGDVVGLGISHPCTTFDKWKHILLIDNDYNIVDIIETRF